MNEESLEAVQDYEWGKSVAPLLELDREIRKVCEHAEERAELEEALTELLQSDASRAAKRFVCQRLGLIGGEHCIPELARMLTRPDASDMARYALERIPSAEVNKALRDAIEKTDGKAKIGVINSIGARKDQDAAPLLGKLLESSDANVAVAAAWALGQLAGDEAQQVLSAAKKSEHASVRLALLDAKLACAEQLLADGRRPEAESIYVALNTDESPPAVRRAAARGVAKLNT